jgi:hypothetical protein
VGEMKEIEGKEKIMVCREDDRTCRSISSGKKNEKTYEVMCEEMELTWHTTKWKLIEMTWEACMLREIM